ncbi:DUF5658 family protein [Massilia sp.]|uniref:DUF5658 family protein n=1 Tax=Massilia sp. TaxID=1882437 RepID=UPI00352BE4DF
MKTPDPVLQRSERKLLAFLCIALAVLQVMDLHSSLRAAQSGRSELNPVILWLIAHVGFGPGVFAFKAVVLIVLGLYYRVVSGFNRMLWPSISLIPVCAAYIAVVLNNYS